MTAMHKTLCKRGLLGLMACGMCFTVLASEYERRVDLLDAYKQECSACHTAYSPAMLGGGFLATHHVWPGPSLWG